MLGPVIEIQHFYPAREASGSSGRLAVWSSWTITIANTILSILGIPFVVVFTLVGGVLAAIPGVALVYWLLVESGLWMLAAFLRYSSIAWRRLALLRVFLLPLGLLLAPLGYLLVALIGGTSAGVKYRKLVFMAACDSWPLADLALDEGERLVSTMAEAQDDLVHPHVHWR